MNDMFADIKHAIRHLETDLTYHSRLTRHAPPNAEAGDAEHAQQLRELEANLRSCETDITYAETTLEQKNQTILGVRGELRAADCQARQSARCCRREANVPSKPAKLQKRLHEHCVGLMFHAGAQRRLQAVRSGCQSTPQAVSPLL